MVAVLNKVPALLYESEVTNNSEMTNYLMHQILLTAAVEVLDLIFSMENVWIRNKMSYCIIVIVFILLLQKTKTVLLNKNWCIAWIPLGGHFISDTCISHILHVYFLKFVVCRCRMSILAWLCPRNIDLNSFFSFLPSTEQFVGSVRNLWVE